MSLPIRIPLMVAMWARMCRLVSEGVGEAITTTTMEITAALAMEGTRDIRGGIGK